jgi:hypothetical protein
MSTFPHAKTFRRQRIAELKTAAIYGVAITQQTGGDQFATVAPDLDTAVRRASGTGLNPDPSGAQDVVLMSASSFAALLAMAGISSTEAT